MSPFKFSFEKTNSHLEAVKAPFIFVYNLFKNLRKSFMLMARWERWLAAILFFAALGLSGWQYERSYMASTKNAPASGGTLTEDMVGQVKFLNPILASSDAEHSVSELLFSGLVQTDGSATVKPDAAESWEINNDGQQYIFHLKKTNMFSDGTALTAADVAYTIDQIKSPAVESPLMTSWTGVDVKIIDNYTLEFDLPTAYGPFIYNCNFGIMPSYMTSDDFARNLTGSGPFKYNKTKKSGTTFSEIDLKRNDDFGGTKPYLDQINIKLFQNEADAITDYNKKADTLVLFGAEGASGTNLDYQSARELGLVFNLRSDKLKDIAVRQKIVSGTRLDAPMTLNLLSLDAPAQNAKAAELKTKLAGQNITLNISNLNNVKFGEAVTAKSYDLVLYGFDFSNDRDPYPFWHSSQLSAMNLAGWSDKNSDILLEDARMLVDPVARNAKYDQFFQTVQTQYLAVFYNPIPFDFFVKDKVQNVSAVTGKQAGSHLDQITGWYLKEKRVKK